MCSIWILGLRRLEPDALEVDADRRLRPSGEEAQILMCHTPALVDLDEDAHAIKDSD
jgi:hypothetical protein